MGESACWLHLVCHACGAVDDHLDADGRCRACRDDTIGDGTGQGTRAEQRRGDPGASREGGAHTDPGSVKPT